MPASKTKQNQVLWFESEISRLITRGYDSARIAATLKIPLGTVLTYRARLKKKAVQHMEQYLDDLALEVESILAVIGDCHRMAYAMLEEDTTSSSNKLSGYNRVMLLNLLKELAKTRLDVVTDLDVVKAAANWSLRTRNQLESLQKKVATKQLVAEQQATVDDSAKRLGQELARITELEESKEITRSEPELARELNSELASADDNDIVQQSIEKEDNNSNDNNN
jgi:hypothetical protein